MGKPSNGWHLRYLLAFTILDFITDSLRFVLSRDSVSNQGLLFNDGFYFQFQDFCLICSVPIHCSIKSSAYCNFISTIIKSSAYYNFNNHKIIIIFPLDNPTEAEKRLRKKVGGGMVKGVKERNEQGEKGRRGEAGWECYF